MRLPGMVTVALAVAVTVLGAVAGAGRAARAGSSDLTGTWHCCGAGGAAEQIFVITDGGGLAKLPSGSVFASIKASGGGAGGSVRIVTTYNSFASGYVAVFVGKLSADGRTMTGTWTSNRSQAGTWTATRTSGPKSSISVAVSVPEGGAGVGNKVKVTVKVTAGAKSLKSVSLGQGLVSGSDLASVVSRPGGLSGFSLAKGASRTFTFSVKALKPGAAALRASASARAGSETVQGSGAATLRIGKAGLAITMAVSPPKFALTVDEKGKVEPTDVKVTVKLTNTSTVPIENVQLLSLRPEPVDLTQRLEQLAFPRGSLPVKVGTMAKKSAVTKTFTLKVTGDGKYQLRALALFADKSAPGGNGRATALGGKFEARVPPLYYTAKLEPDGISYRSGAPWVKGGQSFFISGKVKNVSSWKTLCLLPLKADKAGNVAGTGPVDIAIYGRHAIAPPVVGRLKPGQDLIWGLWGDTSEVGGTRATVEFHPGGVEVKPDASCALERIVSLKPLQPSEITTTKDSTDFTVHVDTSVASYASLGTPGVAWNFFMGAAFGTFTGFSEWLGSTLATARELLLEDLSPENLVKVAALTAQHGFEDLATATAKLYTSLQAAAAIIANYWETATPDEKQSFLGEVKGVLRQARDDAFVGLVGAVDKAFESWTQGIERAYADGDNPEVWRALGATAANDTTKIALDIAVAELAPRLGKLKPKLAETYKKVADSSIIFTKLKGIPAGKLLNFTELKSLWGFAKSDVVAFTRIAKEEGVRIGIRGRSPLSVGNLEEGAVWKHENVKPKNVSPIDVKWLGFDAADDGLVALKQYSPAEKAAIERRIASAPLTDAERAEILKRLETRLGEAPKYLSKLDKASKAGEIDIGFNYSENGLGEPTSPKPRGFHLTEETQANGSKYFRPLQENTLLKPGRKLPKWCRELAARILCRITGDMDGVYLTTQQGRPLPLDKLLRVYKRLEEAGWQHPETFTWVKDMTGEFWFKAKEHILGGLELGGEPMVEFGPDGLPRATYIDLKKSKELSRGTGDWFVATAGGYMALP